MLKQFYCFITLFCLLPFPVYAFDDKQTHPLLTEKAVDNTIDFENVLKMQLGIEEGVNRKLSNGEQTESIIEWLIIGSKEEDEPACRAANHFHNPLKTWSESQLTDPIWGVDKYCDLKSPFREKYSNISWATGYSDVNGTLMPVTVNGVSAPPDANGRNWFVAKYWYYRALVETDPQERERGFTETFRTIGYVLHLLEDMAVPAHTRNDFSQGHFRNVGCPDNKIFCGKEWVGNPFEGYVRDHFDEIDAAITDISKPFTGEKKLTNFWDTDTLSEGDTPQTGFDIGLAEYTNGNFVSYATILKSQSDTEHYFPFPNKDSIADEGFPDQADEQLYHILARDGKLDKGVYITKNKHGEIIQKFLKPRYLFHGTGEFTPSYDLKYTLDDQCYKEYAIKLIPRAVGYTADLIDYFFRGVIDVTLSAETVLKKTATSTGYNQVTLKAQNTSPDGEDMTDGTIELAVRYKLPLTPYFENYPAPPPLIEHYIVAQEKNNTTTIDRDNPVDLVFDLNESIPANAKDVRLQVVYKGKLGHEQDSIATGGINMMTEYPIEITVPDSGYYAMVAGDQYQAIDFSGELKLLARNVTPGGLEMENGRILLDVKYRLPVGDSFVDDPEMAIQPDYVSFELPESSKSGSIVSIPRDTPVELTFNLSNNPIPLNAVDLVIQIRFEDLDGITYTGLKDISEPSPIDVFNTGGVVCIDQQWYEAGSPEAIKLVDINGDGIVGKDEHDIYPHKFNSIYWLFFSNAAPEVATTDLHDFEIVASSNHREQIKLGYILTEYDTYYNLSRSKYQLMPLVPEVDHVGTMYSEKFSGKGFKNQVEFDDRPDCLSDLSDIDTSCFTRSTSFLFPLWGNNTWYPNFIVNPEKGYPPCNYFELPQEEM